MFMPWELPDLLDPEIVREGWRELQPLLHLEETLDGITNSRLKVSCLEMCWYMRNQLLRDSDWAGMAHSLEIRVPLVDVALLRDIGPLLSSATPPTKQDIARAPRTPLPAELINRAKTGLRFPREWLREESGNSKLENRKLTDRGLRGWARQVYGQFPGTRLRRSTSRRAHRFSLASSEGLTRTTSVEKSRRILVFRIGQLGDTIISLPSMWAVKQNFPEAHLALLCDRHPNKRYVLASDLLRGAGIFDEFLSYPVSDAGDILRRGRMASLLAAIRRRRFDTLVYLAPTRSSAGGPTSEPLTAPATVTSARPIAPNHNSVL